MMRDALIPDDGHASVVFGVVKATLARAVTLM
jgi:hypothetical protein